MHKTIAETQTLAPGDRLAWKEFERRWNAEPELKFAELIGGRVYMPSPLSERHGNIHANVATWIGLYAAQTPGTMAALETTCRMMQDAPQPDVLLRIGEDFGGQARVRGKYLYGAPEFVAEICVTSAAYDLNDKLDLYRTAGVQEFLAIILAENEVRWHRLVDGEYEILQPDRKSILRSTVFPGLWLKSSALLAGELSEVVSVLEQGLASAEHSAFSRRLASRAKR